MPSSEPPSIFVFWQPAYAVSTRPFTSTTSLLITIPMDFIQLAIQSARPILLSAVLGCWTLALSQANAQFDLQLTLTNPGAFTPTQLSITRDAMAVAEARWEREIIGYQTGITQTTMPIAITGTTTGFGEANGSGIYEAGGFTLFERGFMRINRNVVEEFSNFRGEGINVIDDLIAHEIGHALGIGTLWDDNGAYVNGTGQYTGAFGLAAYRQEFDPLATFIPVELSGGPGSANAHWDQLLRSAGEAGVADDPFDLSPLIGVVDAQGRDLALDLMTAALDPDFGEPFLSRTTVESLRDIGFVVRAVPEPSAVLLIASGCLASLVPRRR